jgi:hypothetical protein
MGFRINLASDLSKDEKGQKLGKVLSSCSTHKVRNACGNRRKLDAWCEPRADTEHFVRAYVTCS